MAIRRKLKYFKYASFGILLASFMVVGRPARLQAWDCFSGGFESPNYYTFWACGWFWESDPCSDGTAEDLCNDGCLWGTQGQFMYGSVNSCISTGPPYWMTELDCSCYN